MLEAEKAYEKLSNAAVAPGLQRLLEERCSLARLVREVRETSFT